MVLFNHATREMTAKIVYYGPGLCGKTTNLMVIFDKLDPKSKGKMLSLATKTDRTLFFDLLPVDIGRVGAFNLKIQLYTVPGQVFYNETRRLVLKGADAVVFVADSQPSMVESNKQSFANLMENLEQNQLDPNDTPIVIQYNKRDIPGVMPVEQLQEALGLEGYPYTEASALKGDGVMETFKLVSKITAKHLFDRLKGKSGDAGRKSADVKIKAPAPKPEAAAPAPAPPPPPVMAQPEPEPEATPSNPFADSMPFGDSEGGASGYEKMEEVSLEQLLSEGRTRPATMSGDIPIPVMTDDIEEVGPESLLEEESGGGVAVAVMEEPEPQAMHTSSPHSQPSGSLPHEQRQELQAILHELESLTARVRRLIE